jgi:hypothetical protein
VVDILVDSLKDTSKTLPILFITFLLVDYLMNVMNKDNRLIDKLSKYDCLGGAALGIIPQCGIPVAMAKLYSGGFISIGMLATVFLSSSDEALIIIGAHPERLAFMVKLIVLKLLIGIVFGYLVNFFIKEKRNRFKLYDISCDCSKCKDGKSIITRNIKFTLKVFIFLVITVFLINLGMEKVGEEGLYALLGKNSYLQPVYAALIGMIPSCMSSVVLAEGFIKGGIGFGALVAGLCANTGFGILIIFKEISIKKAFEFAILIQAISIAVGELIYILKFTL